MILIKKETATALQNNVFKFFSYLIQNALGYHGDRGLLSSLVGWIAGNATPSFIEGQSLSAEVKLPRTPTLADSVLLSVKQF